MKTYKIVARPNVYFVQPGLGPLISESIIVEALAGVAVRELSEDQQGNRIIDVKLNRPTDAQALEEIIGFVQQLGFSVVEATVSKWINEAVEKAVLRLLGGGGAVGVATKNGIATTIGAAFGALFGGIIGAEAHKLKAEYEARRDYQGNWAFRQISQQPASSVIRPGLSPA
jgi:hypothetical protein